MNTPCDTSTLPAGADIARAFMSTRLGRQPQARKDPRTCAMHFRQHRLIMGAQPPDSRYSLEGWCAGFGVMTAKCRLE